MGPDPREPMTTIYRLFSGEGHDGRSSGGGAARRSSPPGIVLRSSLRGFVARGSRKGRGFGGIDGRGGCGRRRSTA